MRTLLSPRSVAAVAAISLALLSPRAAAQTTRTWTPAAGTGWFDPLNWSGATRFPGVSGNPALNGTAAGTVTDIALFDAAVSASSPVINMAAASGLLSVGAVVATASAGGGSALFVIENSAAAGTLRLNGGYTAVAGRTGVVLAADNGSNLTVRSGGAGTLTVQLAGADSGLAVMSAAAGSTITVSANILDDPALAAGMGVLKDGAGRLVLSGTNGFRRLTRVEAGVLEITQDRSLGAVPGGPAVNLVLGSAARLLVAGNSFALDANRTLLLGDPAAAGAASQVEVTAGSLTINGSVTGFDGTSGLAKFGGGDLVLTGANTYAGGTAVNAGGVYADTPVGVGSATGTGPVRVGPLGLIGGTGRIDGPVTVASGGRITGGGNAPAPTPGTLTVRNDVTIASGGRYLVTVVGSAADRLAVAGTLTLEPRARLEIDGPLQPGASYLIATYAARSGVFDAVFGLPATHDIDYGPTAITLTPVPEPAAVLLAAAGVGLVRRRRPAV